MYSQMMSCTVVLALVCSTRIICYSSCRCADDPVCAQGPSDVDLTVLCTMVYIVARMKKTGTNKPIPVMCSHAKK